MLNNFTKTYAFPQEKIIYERTTMVRHNGTVIAFAMDSEQRIWYTVLDLQDTSVKSPLDFNYWLKNPKPLIFPKELAHIGYSAVTNTTMPDPAPDKREKDKTDEEKFMATTGRLTAAADFQVLSDGKHIYVFRQAISTASERMVWADADQTKPLVDSTLLVDRFVFVGSTLNPKMEVRYQRSRRRSTPLSRKDSLNSKDLNGTHFFEPTHELGIVRGLTEGRFTVLLLPTSVPNLRRWQIFSYNEETEMIDSFNIERSAGGLFNTRGSQFYTCVKHKEIFESQPGRCPHCQEELVPLMIREGFAESAFHFDGRSKIHCGSGPAVTDAQPRTIEAWIRMPDDYKPGDYDQHGVFQYGDRHVDNGCFVLDKRAHDIWYVLIDKDKFAIVDLPGSTSGWHHFCLVYDGAFVTFYYDGKSVTGSANVDNQWLAGEPVTLATVSSEFVIGRSSWGAFQGDIDEVRVWNYARSINDIKQQRHHRLIGNEDGLLAYWRFDEGTGSKLFDQTGNGHHGEIIGSAQWICSDAPVGDNPGVRRSSFKVDGRSVTSGLSAALYFQQEEQTAGYDQAAKPMKKAARVMLTFASTDGVSGKNEVAALDFGLSRDGRLALLRDVVELSTVNTTRAGLTYTETLDEIRKLEDETIPTWKELIAEVQELYAQKSWRRYWYRILFPGDKALTLEGSDPESMNLILDDIRPGDPLQMFRLFSWVPFKHLNADIRYELRESDRPAEEINWNLWTSIGGEEYYYYPIIVNRHTGKSLTHFNPDFGKETKSISAEWGIIPGLDTDWHTARVSLRSHATITWITDPTSYWFSPSHSEHLDPYSSRWSQTSGSPEILRDKFLIISNFNKYVRNNWVFLASDENTLKAPDTSNDQVNIRYINYYTRLRLEPVEGIIEPWHQERLKAIAADLGDHTLSLQQIQSELAARLANSENRLRELKEAILGDVSVPVPVIYTDRFGLTVSGAVLGFAYTSHTPLLFDSANGKLGLYFRGENGRFYAAYFDTMTQKADYALTANTGAISFVARSDDPQMDQAEIKVASGSSPNTCTLTLSGKGVKETWPELPRSPALLARFLNGNASPLTTDRFYYDYNQVDVQPAGMNTAFGSTLFRAFPGTATGSVNDQLQSQKPETRVNRWVADSQGNALSLDGTASFVTETDDAEHFGTADDLTLEAWIKPQSTDANHSQIIHHHSAASSYLLSLRRQTTNQFSVVAAVGEHSIETEAHYPYDHWTHLAVVHQQSFGLSFDGKDDFLETQASEPLNIDGDLTIELFFQPEALGKPQGLLSKGRLRDGSDQQVPYALHLEKDGSIVFTFEQKDGGLQKVRSSTKVSAQFHRLAITREQGRNPVENKSEKTVKVKQWEKIRLYLDGAEVGSETYESTNTGRSNQPLTVGHIFDERGQALFFQGKIGELRIWNSARSASEIGGQIQGDEQSLVAWWRFEENEEYVALDSKGSDHLTLSGAVWTKSPDPRASTLKIYVNGLFQPAEESDALPYGDNQFTLGAVLQHSAIEDRLKGLMEETRIWKSARTQEQIQDNQFRRLIGEWRDLIAYYQFDAEDAALLKDQSGNGHDLAITACKFRLSDAPVAFETPQVRNALAGVETEFQVLISGRPAVEEYGDLQRDADGELMGSMKRCYAYIKDDEWHLITGFKIGNLVTEWVGQAQFAPQLVGFIEGAPPVPSENLTAGPINPSKSDYTGASSLEVVEAENVQYTFSTASEKALNSAFALSAGLGSNVEGTLLEIVAPMGVGLAYSTPDLFDIDIEAAINSKVERSNGWSDEKSMGSSRNLTRSMSVSLGGNWEDPTNPLNPDMRRRYQPANPGFALVKSETADIFALRLAHNNALVAYRMRPNPDIPKDWNIIPFPINPHYTKQGTLDGSVGKVRDPDYKNAKDYGEYSYFKPREAYTLKRRLEKEMEEERTYFANFNASPLARAGMPINATASAGAGLLAGMSSEGAGVAAGIDAISKSLAKRGKLANSFAKRNLVNTYVWTADGGFFAESTEISEVQQETVGGTFAITSTVDRNMASNIDILGVSISLEMEASLGGSLNVTKSKSKEAERAFSINVEVNVPGDLQEYNEQLKRQYDDQGSPKIVPGKVDAYRFMTFYLEPSTNNFDVFVNQVVDPKWLAEDDGANAAALREAVNARNKIQKETEKSLPWRVFNRVTFFSRILQPIPDKTDQPTEKLLRELNIDSNYELIKRLEPFVRAKTNDYAEFSRAVRDAIANYEPRLISAADDIVRFMSLYFQIFQE